MNIFTKKNILQKIIIVIVTVILFNFIVPNISKAESGEDWGGVLFTPIQELILRLGDATMYIIAITLTDDSVDNIIKLSTDSDPWYVRVGASIIRNIITSGLSGAIESGAVILDKLNIIDAPKEIVPNEVELPLFSITPEKIFSNEVPFLDVNIINPNVYKNNDGEKIDTAATVLQSTVSSWYISLRNLAIIGMLSILVYVGIRILLSSTASDKAKYKQLIVDWLVAICLLFFMHYIMSFAVTIVEELTKSLNTSIKVPAIRLDLSEYELTPEQEEIIIAVDSVAKQGDGEEYTFDKSDIDWITDFTGLARFRAQLDFDNATDAASGLVGEGLKAQMAYTIMYAVLVIYTVMFVFQYLKRLIYIIFLTIIAPLVALTYPIDKMNDGSAQAFNMWLKEYIFNLLLQPFHLLLYTLLVGTAIELATDHLIYTLAVLGFMLPAEKVLRKFFGFEKASTGASIMGGAVGGAMVMNAIGAISNKAKGGVKKVASGGTKQGDNENVRWSDRSSDDSANEDNFLMETLGGSSDRDNSHQDNANNFNAENNENKLREQEEMQELQDYFDNTSNEEAYMNPEQYQRNLDRYNELENKQKQSNELRLQNENDGSRRVSESQNSGPEVNGIKGPSKKGGKFTRTLNSTKKVIGAAAPIAGRGLKKVGKGVVKAYGAAALGTIGVAAGLASENYSNVFKYGVAGATAGSALTEVAINKGKNLPSNVYRKAKNVQDEYMKNYYEDDPAAYKKYMNKQADKAFMNDKDVQKLYKDKFGSELIDNGNGQREEKYKVAMKKAKKYREHGITDNDVIIKAMKANVKGVSKEMDSNQRIAAAKYANQVSNEKDIQTMSDRLKKRGVAQDKLAAQEDMLRQIKGLN